MPTGSADVDWHEPLLERSARLSGSLEVGVHPGHDDEWRNAERLSVLEFARRARERGDELVGWSAA